MYLVWFGRGSVESSKMSTVFVAEFRWVGAGAGLSFLPVFLFGSAFCRVGCRNAGGIVRSFSKGRSNALS